MNNKKNLSCSTRNLKTPHIYSTGWWVCKKCSHKNNEKKILIRIKKEEKTEVMMLLALLIAKWPKVLITKSV